MTLKFRQLVTHSILAALAAAGTSRRLVVTQPRVEQLGKTDGFVTQQIPSLHTHPSHHADYYKGESRQGDRGGRMNQTPR